MAAKNTPPRRTGATAAGGRRKTTTTTTTTTTKKAAPPAETKPSETRPIRRRAADGRLDPEYAAELLEKSGSDRGDHDDKAFLTRHHSEDELAEELGEGFLQGATTGENNDEAMLDPVDPDEQGGPFIETTAEQEFAYGPDASNPEGAEREPFPTTRSSS